MRGNASPKRLSLKPKSLMQRLAMVAGGSGSESPHAAAYQPGFGAYFGIGLVGGGAAGAIALLAVQWLGPLLGSAFTPEVPSAIAALAPWVTEPAKNSRAKSQPLVAREPQPDTFNMVIDRSAGASVPFGLRLVGAEQAGMQVLLRGVPAATLLSRGEQRDASTWALDAADLENLHLTLNDRTPDAFDVRIDVLAPPGVAAASSIAHVRLVGLLSAQHMASAPMEATPVEPAGPDTVAAEVVTPFQTRTVVSSRSDAVGRGREKAARISSPPAATTVVEIDRRPPQTASQTEERHWPEGASGLGAIARESDRQVWWKLPALTWSPFLDVAGR